MESPSPILRGMHNVSLDGKGRFAIPVKYREPLKECCASQLVVTVDRDGCLLIYPLPEWQKIEARIMGLSAFDPKVRAIQRTLVGYASEVEMDSQGRLLLPGPLRSFARLDKQAVLMGQGHKFELWDETVWAERQQGWFDDSALVSGALPDGLKDFSL